MSNLKADQRAVQRQEQRGPGGPGGHGGKMRFAFTKEQIAKGTWKKLLTYCKQYVPAIVFAILCAAGGSIITLVGPHKIGELTNVILAGVRPLAGGSARVDLDRVYSIAGFLAVLYVIGALLSLTQSLTMVTVTQRLIQRLRRDLSRKINRLPMAYFHDNATGDVLSRIANDADMLGVRLKSSVSTLVSASTLFVGSLIMMFATNVIMALAGVGTTIIGFILMGIIMKVSQKHFVHQQNALGAVNGYVEELYSGHLIVQAYNGGQKAIQEFNELNQDLRQSGFRAQALSGLMMPLMTFIGNLGYVVVCVVGAGLALKGVIEFGVIVAFMMYIRFFTQPLSQFAQGAQALQTVGATASRIFTFLDEKELSDESGKSHQLDHVEGYVDFEHVHFGYEPGKSVIHDFSISVKPGQKVAIVGPTGAGKTTLMNLLMRFYELDSGQIKIDGVPISEMTRTQVHNLFDMVLQDAWVFEGTVRENLIYCTRNVSDERMRQAAKQVGLNHFIQTLPKGYDTVLNDQVALSQGQRQQLTIARAIISDKPMLILDEATSSIDTRTELKIQQAMDSLMQGRTSFVIAHRLSTIKDADVILVVHDGDIVEKGTHEELLEKGGFYAELYNSQFTEM